MSDIYKAAGILLKERKLLITRSKGKDFFVSPGGKIEAGESAIDALIRELEEELTIAVTPQSLTSVGTFHAPALGAEESQLHMEVFLVQAWDGKIQPAHEVEELRWVTSVLPENLVLGSIFAYEVIPRLKAQGLID